MHSYIDGDSSKRILTAEQFNYLRQDLANYRYSFDTRTPGIDNHIMHLRELQSHFPNCGFCILLLSEAEEQRDRLEAIEQAHSNED